MYGDLSLWDADPAERERFMRRFGILYQQGALWSSMTLAENVALPLQLYTKMNAAQIRDLVSLENGPGGTCGFR